MRRAVNCTGRSNGPSVGSVADMQVAGPLLIAWGALAGLIAGSFVGALVTRWPRGEGVSRGRSRCDGCGGTLRAWELAPLISFLWLGGRCRRCDGRIDPVQPVSEACAALIGASALASAPLAYAVPGMFFGWTLLALALLDWRHLWLPDLLTLPLLGIGIAVAGTGYGIAARDGIIGAAAGYTGLAAVGASYRAIRGRIGVGGGDPKLLAALGAWLGWQSLPILLLLASSLGLALAAWRLARGGRVTAATSVPLGTLMAAAAWPLWLLGSKIDDLLVSAIQAFR